MKMWCILNSLFLHCWCSVPDGGLITGLTHSDLGSTHRQEVPGAETRH